MFTLWSRVCITGACSSPCPDGGISHCWMIWCLLKWSYVWTLLGCRTVTWAHQLVFLFYINTLQPAVFGLMPGHERLYFNAVKSSALWCPCAGRLSAHLWVMQDALFSQIEAANFKGRGASEAGAASSDLLKWTSCFLPRYKTGPLASPLTSLDDLKEAAVIRVSEAEEGGKALTLKSRKETTERVGPRPPAEYIQLKVCCHCAVWF